MRRRIRQAGSCFDLPIGNIAMDAPQFLTELDQLFELDPGTVSLADVIQDLPGWSSLTFMGLIALTDEELGVMLTPDRILGCETVADLLREAGLIEAAATSHAA